MKRDKIWSCKIGLASDDELPFGADSLLRKAVIEAFRLLLNRDPDFAFTGWGGALTKTERALVETKNRNLDLPQ